MTQFPDQEKVTLVTLAGRCCFLTGAGCVLSGISVMIGLVSYLCTWNVMKLAVTGWLDRMDESALVYWGWMAIISSLINMLAYFGALMYVHLSTFHTARNMKIVILHHLTRFPVEYFKQRGSGKLGRIIDGEARQTRTYLVHQLPDLVGALVTLVAVLVLLLVFDWRFGLISLVPMAVGALFLSRMMGPGVVECMGQHQNALEGMNNEAVEYMRGIPVAKTFQRSVFPFKSFHDSISRYRDWVVNHTVSLRIPMCIYTVSINGIFALLIPAGILLAGDIPKGTTYETTALDLLFYIPFTPTCVSMMDEIMWTSEDTMTVRNAVNRILDIIKEKPLPEPVAAIVPSGYTVEFKDISFSHDNTGMDALSHVPLAVLQGATAVMVGAPGSGETTLVSLIPRFPGVDRGSIYIGGVDVRETGSKGLVKLVSFVFQDYRLLKDSLLNDIRTVRPQATEEEMMRVVATARCEDTIGKIPQGLDTAVGTESTYPFGGRAQRTVLVRVTLKDMPIVFLDEATALAGPDNEYLIQQAFETSVKGKIVIMIAHRLSTVCHSDRILIPEQGRIAEQGRREELLRSGELYAKMWKDYQTSVEWKVGGEV